MFAFTRFASVSFKMYRYERLLAVPLVAIILTACGDITAGLPDSGGVDTAGDSVIRVSVASDGTQGNDDVWNAPAISGGGRYVAFSSRASNLVASDTNSTDDIFLHDTQDGTTTRMSVASDGTQAGGHHNTGAAISADGRYVAFHSDAMVLVTDDTNNINDIFLRDTQTGIIVRASLPDSSTGQAQAESPYCDSSSEQGCYYSYFPSISGDGRYVAFESTVENLVFNDTNGFRDIFVRDTQTGATIRINATYDAATQSNGNSSGAAISADGLYVAFSSDATNFVAYDINMLRDVFVRDIQAGTTIRVNVASNGLQSDVEDINLARPAISADGRYVAFYSYATNLVYNDTNSAGDIFLHDTQDGTTIRVSVPDSAIGQTEGDGASYGPPSISGDGRYVAFYSDATNLVADDTNGVRDVFVHDTQTGATTRVSSAVDGSQSDDRSSDPSISADGQYVVFSSYAGNLVLDDTNGRQDFFRALNTLYGK